MGKGQSSPKKYGVYVGEEKKGESRILHSAIANESSMIERDTDTMLNQFMVTTQNYGSYPLFGSREKLPNNTYGKYKWKTYLEVKHLAIHLAQAIESQKLYNKFEYLGKNLRTIGIYSRNREEWLLTDISCWMISVTNVPLYDTLGDESIARIFEQTMLSSVFLSDQGIAKLVDLKRKGKLPSLKTMICYDQYDASQIEAAKDVGIELRSFSVLLKEGEKAHVPLRPCKPNDLMTICYTSGTTGLCKGVEISHRAFYADAKGNLHIEVFDFLKPGMAYFSYLPLAHVFERVLCYIMIHGAFKIGFSQGNILKLTEDLQEYKPYVLVGVPRVYCRFYEQIMSTISKMTGFKKKLIDRAIASKKAAYEKNGSYKHWLYDALVFRKIRNVMGGKLGIFVSAAAPMEPNILAMLKILFSAPFLQGYGQSETAGSVSLSYIDDNLPGTIGPPTMICEAKVVDVPEMKYFSTDLTNGELTPRGELCVRGLNVTKRYFKDPEKTKEAIDKNGWLHTGDIAIFNQQGLIRIIDRKKNIFKLQQGEYVAPEKIENLLVNSKFVLQIFAYGDSFQTFIVAIIYPKKEVVMEWAKESNLEKTFEELCASEELNAAIMVDITQEGKRGRLAGFEMIKKIFVTPKPFTIENNTMTPTFKIRRNEAKAMYASEIERLYKEPLPVPTK